MLGLWNNDLSIRDDDDLNNLYVTGFEKQYRLCIYSCKTTPAWDNYFNKIRHIPCLITNEDDLRKANEKKRSLMSNPRDLSTSNISFQIRMDDNNIKYQSYNRKKSLIIRR